MRDPTARRKRLHALQLSAGICGIPLAVVLSGPPLRALAAGPSCSAATIANGGDSSLALTSDGSVLAWGNNTNGQLGNGNTLSYSAPTQGPTGPFASLAGSAAATGGGSVWTWGYNDYGELGNGTPDSSPHPNPSRVPNLTGVIQISEATQVLALTWNGTVWAWGRNNNGQVGNGTTTDSAMPVEVLGPSGSGFLSGIVKVVAGGGDEFSLALKADGTVWSWGSNSFGQLGNGNPGVQSSTPVQVVGTGGSGFLSGVVDIAAGGNAAGALRSDGTVWTWGWNAYGQLGDGTMNNSSTPVQVLDAGGSNFLSGVGSISAGGTAFLVVKPADGSVWGWGQDINGQLGDGQTTTAQTSPVQTIGVGGTGHLTGIVSVAAGPHSLALTSSGTMYAWGYNRDGQLGNGTTSGYDANPIPTQVVGQGGSGVLAGVAQPGGCPTGPITGPLSGAYGPGEIQSAYNLPGWRNGSNAIPNGLYRHSAVLANGYLFVIGGNDGYGAVSTVYSAPVSSSGAVGTWRNLTATPLPHALQGQSAVLANNHVFVLGGDDGSSIVSSVYSAAINSDGTLTAWTNLTFTPLPIPLSEQSAVVASGHIIVTGGVTAAAPTVPLNSVYIAAVNSDGTLGQWLPNPTPLTRGLRLHSAVVVSTFLVISGGDDASGSASNAVYSAPITPLGTVGAFAPQVNSLPVPLDSHRAVAYNGYVIVTGGYTNIPNVASPAVYYVPVDASTGVVGAASCLSNQVPCWRSSYNQLPQPIVEHALVVANGKLIVTGGFNPAVGQVSSSVFTAPPNVVTGTTTSGAPATVAVVFWRDDPNAEFDLQVYRNYFHLPTCTTTNGCFKKVYQNLGSSVPTGSRDDSSETSLDVEMVSAACPNCHILLVEANSRSAGDIGQSENTAANYGATDGNFAPISISNSYGAPEAPEEITAPLNTYFDHPGIVITAAAGNGGYCSTRSSCPQDGGVLWPAADPHIVAVGGTYLTFSPGSGWSESVWHNNYGTSAGGCSLYEPKPSWQAGVTDAACSGRMVADVSAVADGPQGLAHYSSYQDDGWVRGHGTSAATPIVAATIALSGSALTAQYLYSHAGSLHDLTTGSNVTNNGNCGSSGTSTYYLCNAGPGYDGPSGLGTPNGTAAFGP